MQFFLPPSITFQLRRATIGDVCNFENGKVNYIDLGSGKFRTVVSRMNKEHTPVRIGRFVYCISVNVIGMSKWYYLDQVDLITGETKAIGEFDACDGFDLILLKWDNKLVVISLMIEKGKKGAKDVYRKFEVKLYSKGPLEDSVTGKLNTRECYCCVAGDNLWVVTREEVKVVNLVTREEKCEEVNLRGPVKVTSVDDKCLIYLDKGESFDILLFSPDLTSITSNVKLRDSGKHKQREASAAFIFSWNHQIFLCEPIKKVLSRLTTKRLKKVKLMKLNVDTYVRDVSVGKEIYLISCSNVIITNGKTKRVVDFQD